MRQKSAVIPILLATILVFMLQIVLGDGFTRMFMLASEDVFRRPWILFTSMFLHGSFSHILFNMYGLFIFGPILEQRIGAKRFLTLYLLSGVISAFIASFFYSRALGASGAIMGMLGALIILMPELQLLFFFIIPMPLWIAGIVWAGIDIFGVFNPSGVGNIAHLVGMGFGLMYGFQLKGKRKVFRKRFHKRKHLDDSDIEEYLRSGRI